MSKLDNSFLYGDGVEVPEIPADIIIRRIELLKEHLDDLFIYPCQERESYRINAVKKAIDFWEKFGKEST